MSNLDPEDQQAILDILQWRERYLTKRLDQLERKQLNDPHASRATTIDTMTAKSDAVTDLIDRFTEACDLEAGDA
ncbi:MAG: hypothetical protein ACQEVD_02305 [Actinomycetota bacterium]